MDTAENGHPSSSDDQHGKKHPDLFDPAPPSPPPPILPPPPPPPMTTGTNSNDLLSFDDDEQCVNHNSDPLVPQAAFMPPGFEPLSFDRADDNSALVEDTMAQAGFDAHDPRVGEPVPEPDLMPPVVNTRGNDSTALSSEMLPPEAEPPEEGPPPEVVPPPPPTSMEMMPPVAHRPFEEDMSPVEEDPHVGPPSQEVDPPAEPEELPPAIAPSPYQTETYPQSDVVGRPVPNGFEPLPHTVMGSMQPVEPESQPPEGYEEASEMSPTAGTYPAEPDTLPLVVPPQMDSGYSLETDNEAITNGPGDSGMETSPVEMEVTKPSSEVTTNGLADSGMETSPVEVETAPCGKEPYTYPQESDSPFDIEKHPPAYGTENDPPTWMDSDKQSEVECVSVPVPLPLPPALPMVEVPPVDYDVIEDEGEATTVEMMDDKKDRDPTCCERCLRCLSHVPCGSLISWIMLVLGLGSLAGSALIGTRKTRTLLQDDHLLWFMELTVTGVVVSMFVLGTCFLLVGHVSTDPTSRRLFNTTSKNSCARGLNIFLLVLVYFLCLCWVLASTAMAAPVVLLVMMFLVTGNYDPSECLELHNYGFPARQICNPELMAFKDDAQDVLICFGVTLLAVILVIVSLIHFLICVSSNITHLHDNRFAALNAYDENDETGNSKPSMLDTNM